MLSACITGHSQEGIIYKLDIVFCSFGCGFWFGTSLMRVVQCSECSILMLVRVVKSACMHKTMNNSVNICHRGKIKMENIHNEILCLILFGLCDGILLIVVKFILKFKIGFLIGK